MAHGIPPGQGIRRGRRRYTCDRDFQDVRKQALYHFKMWTGQSDLLPGQRPFLSSAALDAEDIIVAETLQDSERPEEGARSKTYAAVAGVTQIKRTPPQ